MLKDVKNPNDYLEYSEQVLKTSGVLKYHPKIRSYYKELCLQFNQVFYDRTVNSFDQWRSLLAIDAQIQILLELVRVSESSLCETFGMSEDELIKMIQNDKDYFYRELVGLTVNQAPEWGLIYMSEV